jgi:hypothetical protein
MLNSPEIFPRPNNDKVLESLAADLKLNEEDSAT